MEIIMTVMGKTPRFWHDFQNNLEVEFVTTGIENGITQGYFYREDGKKFTDISSLNLAPYMTELEEIPSRFLVLQRDKDETVGGLVIGEFESARKAWNFVMGDYNYQYHLEIIQA